MNRRRLVAAMFFSAVIIALLSVIVYTERVNADQTVAVWLLTHDVGAGAQYSTADVQQVRVRAQDGDFNYEQRPPNDFRARYSRSLHAHDIIRSDDLVPDGAQAEVALAVQDPPPLSVGDHVDVFAALSTGQQALVGHNVVVTAVSGGSLVILVPVGDEAAWIALGSSSTTLHAARSVPGAQINPPPLSANDAVGILCGSACAAAGGGIAGP